MTSERSSNKKQRERAGSRSASVGLDRTLELLATTKNEAAADLLLATFDTPEEDVRLRSLTALLTRRGDRGGRELLSRWDTLTQRERELIAEHPGKMSSAIREASLSKDDAACRRGCAAAVALGEYDLVPALINAAEDSGHPQADVAAATVLALAESLYDELAGPRDYRRRRDPQLLRRHVLSNLEKSVDRFVKHRRHEVIEAFALLASRDNAKLKGVLHNPHDPAYLPLVEVLTASESPGILRLLIGFLDDPHTPGSVLGVIAHRSDGPLVDSLLKKIGYEPSPAVAANLKRIKGFAWLGGDMSRLDKLDGGAQHAVVQLIMHSGISRIEAFKFIKHLVTGGQVAGRRAASAALAEFKGAEANRLVLEALQDEDPAVLANSVRQLRDRGIAGAMNTLIGLIDSSHHLVRRAARESLPEFNFKRYITSFDTLDDDVRRSTGELVRKIDVHALSKLEQELACGTHSRQVRAVRAAEFMNAVPQVEGALIRLMKEGDHLLRAEVARALSVSGSQQAVTVLRDALMDRNVSVREAAEDSLRQIAHAPEALGATEEAAL